MKKLIVALGALFLVLGFTRAQAANCSGYSYTLTNGQVADATQVMSNFNSILSCANSNLAHNGANTDITSLGGLTTPLSAAQGGTGNINGTATPSGSAGGQLAGTYPNPTLATGAAVSNIGYTPVNKAGDTLTGKLTTLTSGTSAAPLNIPQGSAPTTPSNGDVWTTSTGVFARINGSTQQLASTTGAVTSFNSRTGAVSLTSGDVTGALTYTPLNQAGDTLGGTLVMATGTTTVAPFKFVAGTNLTSAAAGAVEWDGTNMYLTQTTGPTRKTVAYADGNITGSAAKWTTVRTETLSGDVTGSQSVDGSANWTITTTIANAAVTGAKIANTTITASNIANATITGTQIAATTVAGSNMVNGTVTSTQIASNTVANSNLSNMAANSLKGNNTGVSAAPADLTVSQVATLLGGTTSGTLAAGNDSRFVGPTQNSQSTSYTLVLSDGGGQVYHPSADVTARTWTIPANGTVAFQIGAKVELVNDCSAGALTISITTDTLVWFPSGGTGSRTLAACGIATLTKVGSTRWVITGVGVS